MNQTGQSLPSENLQTILDSAKNAADLGTQQFITPLALAEAIARPLPQWRGLAADLQCGDGTLLAGMRSEKVIGCDIQPAAVRKSKAAFGSDGQFDCADLTMLYPLLVEADCQFDLVALNPPFGLQWHTDRIKDLAGSRCAAVSRAFSKIQGKDNIDSSFATFLIALDRLTLRGEGIMICPRAAAEKILFAAPDDYLPLCAHVWAAFHVKDCTLFSNATFDMVVLYFKRDGGGRTAPTLMNVEGPDQLQAIQDAVQKITLRRALSRSGFMVNSQYDSREDTAERWEMATKELQPTGVQPQQNIWLEADGRIGVYLTPFQTISTKLSKSEVKSLWSLRQQFPSSLVVQKETRSALLRAVHGTLWKVDPALIQIVDQAVLEYDAIRAPFFPLNEVQRLGFLDEEDSIVCKKDFQGFTAGQRYPIACATRTLVQYEDRRNLADEIDRVQISGCEMVVTITDSQGNRFEFLPHPTSKIVDKGRLNPVDPSNGQDLAALIEHFEIPKVPDIAEIYPEKYQAAIRAIREIESSIR